MTFRHFASRLPAVALFFTQRLGRVMGWHRGLIVLPLFFGEEAEGSALDDAGNQARARPGPAGPADPRKEVERVAGLIQRLTGAAARRERAEAERREREQAEARARQEAERRRIRNLIANLARLLIMALNIVLLLVRERMFRGAGPGCRL
jgi:hypothetical protein